MGTTALELKSAAKACSKSWDELFLFWRAEAGAFWDTFFERPTLIGEENKVKDFNYVIYQIKARTDSRG
jgi:hypothetical protein